MANNRDEKADNFQKITDKIVEAVEAGTMPWHCPWDRSAGMPKNGFSDYTYSGINVWSCWLNGHQDPRHYTKNQILKLHKFEQVEKKSKGKKGKTRKVWEYAGEGEAPEWPIPAGLDYTPIIFWKFIDQRVKNEDGEFVLDESGDPVTERRPFLRLYSVLNHEQIKWDPRYEPQAPEAEPFDLEESHAKAVAFIKNTGAIINHGGSRAFYSPSEDRIGLPDSHTFESPEAYFATAFHELTHWTGKVSRCDRDLKGRFDIHAYAMEELVAELGAAFLCAEFGVAGTTQHPEYIASWLKVLKKDKHAIFHAARKAQEAVKFLHSLQGDAIEYPEIDDQGEDAEQAA